MTNMHMCPWCEKDKRYHECLCVKERTERKTSDTINEDIASMQQFALPEYIVFLILGHVKELKQVAPDHILVKAVEGVLSEELDALDQTAFASELEDRRTDNG